MDYDTQNCVKVEENQPYSINKKGTRTPKLNWIKLRDASTVRRYDFCLRPSHATIVTNDADYGATFLAQIARVPFKVVDNFHN